MKTAAQYIVLDCGTRPFARAVELNDTDSILSIMEDYSNGEVKAFQNDLKSFIDANPKATGKQILEYFKLG